MPVGEELHRALEVREEDRDLLALALEGVARGQDLLREVLGGVGLSRGLALYRVGGGRRAAGAAELLVREQLGATARAAGDEAATALLTEPHALAVLGLAAGTLHLGPPRVGAVQMDSPPRVAPRNRGGQGLWGGWFRARKPGSAGLLRAQAVAPDQIGRASCRERV